MPEENPRRKSSSMPLIIGVIVVALIAAGGYYGWKTFMAAEAPAPAPIVDQTPPAPISNTYASSTMKFSLTYPQGFTLQEPYAYTRVSPTKPITGVKFTLPASMTQGTNLALDSGISVEQLPRANLCTGDIFIKANVKAQSVTEGTLTFSVATSSETIAPDTFEEMVYALPNSKPCVGVRYFLHSTAASTSTSAFNRATIIAAFDEIRRSLTVTP